MLSQPAVNKQWKLLSDQYLWIIHGEERLQVGEEVGVDADQWLDYRYARKGCFGAGDQLTLLVELAFAVIEDIG